MPRRDVVARAWYSTCGAALLRDPGRVAQVGGAGPAADGHSLRGDIFPKFLRRDLLESAVVAQRMRAGLIEETQIPRNPL